MEGGGYRGGGGRGVHRCGRFRSAAPRHFPYVTRTLLDLLSHDLLPNVKRVTVEPEWGYTARIEYRDGSTRMTYGNDIGLNPAAAVQVVQDKAHTKYFLRESGFETPDGEAFVCPWWAERLTEGPRARERTAIRTIEAAPSYVRRSLGLPVFVKPVDGSKGSGVTRCDTTEAVVAALAELGETRVKVALVERAVTLPDYRIVVLRDDVISAYRRDPLAVQGDGRTSIRGLVDALAARYATEGRDTRIDLDDPRLARCLARQGHDLASVPRAGTVVPLHDISNLSTGGTALDVTHSLHDRWRGLAIDVSRMFGLCYCGLDIACADATCGDAQYSILEVNGAPGLDHYASVGSEQDELVRNLYARVLNAGPAPTIGG